MWWVYVLVPVIATLWLAFCGLVGMIIAAMRCDAAIEEYKAKRYLDG